MSAEARSVRRPLRLPASAAIARRVLFAALEQMSEGALELRFPDGVRRRFGSEDCDAIVVEILDERWFGRLALSGKLGPGEGYMAGEWRTSDLVGLFELIARNAEHVFDGSVLGPLARAARALPRLPRLPSLRRSERDVQAHYDLGNEFFELFLDDSLTYSAGIFDRPGMSLADAQQAKFARLCNHLRLGPEHHLLEIGSGWGAMAIHAARERGCRVTTVTISRAQHALATRRVHEAGLAERVEVRYLDYRLVQGRFDRVVSIEMIEAIGHRQFPTYFAAIDRVLARDGVAAIQAILIPDQRYHSYRRSRDWIRKHIFPGGLLPSLTVLAEAMTRSSRLTIHAVDEIGPHYAETLRRWRENFLANRERVRALGFDEPFLRKWEYYLAFCEAAFRTHALRDVQLVLTRPMNGSLARLPG